MSNIVYVVPWAICDTDHMYIKKVSSQDDLQLQKGIVVDDWTIRDIIQHPDRRCKDTFVILDVYRGYDFGKSSKTVSFVELSNSVSKLNELGYSQGSDEEITFLRQRILKLDKVDKKTNIKRIVNNSKQLDKKRA